MRRPTSMLPSSESVDAPPVEQPWVEEEKKENPASLKDRQIRMEQQVYRIWT